MARTFSPGRFDHSYVQYVDPPLGDAETLRTRIQKDDLLVQSSVRIRATCVAMDLIRRNVFVCKVWRYPAIAAPIIRVFELFFVSLDGGRG